MTVNEIRKAYNKELKIDIENELNIAEKKESSEIINYMEWLEKKLADFLTT